MRPAAPSLDPVVLRHAVLLSLGAAVSLGITRFAYGLLLPPMRDDLGWSYALAGAMNTSNAVGYLLGALLTPLLLRRMPSGVVLLWGALIASVLTAVSGLFTDSTVWLLQRLAAGVASALVFMTGGLLAARLGSHAPTRAGLLLGVYYGGTGLGISLSALVVPLTLQLAAALAHPWAVAWAALALLCFGATALLRSVVHQLALLDAAPVTGGSPGAATAISADANQGSEPTAGGSRGAGAAPGDSASAAVGSSTSAADRAHGAAPLPLRRYGFALAGYVMFGIGYIGYMTFIVALLRDQGMANVAIMGFYALLGVAVMASSRLWAGLLDRYRDGRPLALFNALLGAATLAPALSSAWPVVLASCVMFGAVFLSVVASTTAWVRHNLPPGQWARGIGTFTITFAAGQIVGPTVVGWIADGPGGLARGFVVSALVLWLGALLALGQRGVAGGR